MKGRKLFASKMEAEEHFAGFYRDSTQIFSVLEALNKQRLKSELCDVTLKVFNTKITAHSCVLAAASPYFADLFCTQDQPRIFSQSNPQEIEIHVDVEGVSTIPYVTAVSKIIEFMYTNALILEVGEIAEVLEMANVMDMKNVIGTHTVILN